MQRSFGQDQQRAGHHQVVALDKADEGQDNDDQNVVTAEWNAVEFAAKNMAGSRSHKRPDFRHFDSPSYRLGGVRPGPPGSAFRSQGRPRAFSTVKRTPPGRRATPAPVRRWIVVVWSPYRRSTKL